MVFKRECTVPHNPRVRFCLQTVTAHHHQGKAAAPTHLCGACLDSPQQLMFHCVQPHGAKHPSWNGRYMVAQNPGQGAQVPAGTQVSKRSRYPGGNTMEGPWKATWVTRTNSVLLAVFWAPVLPTSSCLLLYSVFTDSVLLTLATTLPQDTESELWDD